ncbi:MAG: GNAT family N-acetyltransferase [bacterium]
MKQIELINLKESDLQPAVKVFLKAFQVENEVSIASNIHKLWNDLIRYEIADFIAAKVDLSIVGVGALIKFINHGWISFLGVDPDFQKMKIGYNIFQALMERSQQYSYCSLKLNATETGRKLYLKFNFKPEYEVIQYHLKPEYNLEEFKDWDIHIDRKIEPWCLNLDQQAFGVDRAVFFKMMIDAGAKIIKCSKQGFGLVSQDKLGPIVAENFKIARKIVKFSTVVGVKKIFVPQHSDLSSKYLPGLIANRKNNLRSCTRMVWGNHLQLNDHYMFGAHSFAFG